MIFEIRTYEAAEGCAEALRSRFKLVASKLYPRHGIELLGAFLVPADDARLTYMTRFPDEDTRKSAWAALLADPEWAQIKAASETNGPLLKSQSVSVLTPAIPGLLLG